MACEVCSQGGRGDEGEVVRVIGVKTKWEYRGEKMKGKEVWERGVASLDSYGQGMVTYLKCCSKVIPMQAPAQPPLVSWTGEQGIR